MMLPALSVTTRRMCSNRPASAGGSGQGKGQRDPNWGSQVAWVPLKLQRAMRAFPVSDT